MIIIIVEYLINNDQFLGPVMLDEFVEWLRQRYSSSEKIIDRS